MEKKHGTAWPWAWHARHGHGRGQLNNLTWPGRTTQPDGLETRDTGTKGKGSQERGGVGGESKIGHVYCMRACRPIRKLT